VLETPLEMFGTPAGDVMVSMTAWEAAGMDPDDFKAIFTNRTGFWSLLSEVTLHPKP